jgi:hypothetical protein
MGPIRLVTWVAQRVSEEAEREFYDEDAVRGRLVELELQYEMGEITEEDYLAAEQELLARLEAIRERQGAAEQED